MDGYGLKSKGGREEKIWVVRGTYHLVVSPYIYVV